MAYYFSSYELRFKIENEYIRGRLIGTQGISIRQVEKMFGVRIKFHDETVMIQGGRENVFNAENHLVKQIMNKSFVAELDDSYTGYIIGKNGNTIKDIRSQSNAHIHISKSLPRTIEVTGQQECFDKAIVKIMDRIEAKLRDEFKVYREDSSFKLNIIEEGEYSACIVKDQIKMSPTSFFLQFNNSHENETLFTPIPLENKFLVNKPPKTIHKEGAVLAPYDGYLYRAMCIGIRRSDDGKKILLKVKFVDFGNIDIVDLMLCRDCPREYLYAQKATAVTLHNIKHDIWRNESLYMFRGLLQNNADQICKATVVKSDLREAVEVKLHIPGLGDLTDYLVGVSIAEWKDHPFLPLSTQTIENNIGSSELLYVLNDVGYTVKIEAASCKRVDETRFTVSTGLSTPSILDSLNAAYTFSKRYLEEQGCHFLDDNSLHFSVENKEKIIHQYYGPSCGLVLCICIISECLDIAIPGEVAFTGQVTGHGNLFEVGDIFAKLTAAKNIGKKLVYVPEANLIEAKEIDCGMEIKGFREVSSVLKDLWKF